MWADYLAHFYPRLSIKTAAKRIKDRTPLLHSYAKIA
jgi:hypothetical protein